MRSCTRAAHSQSVLLTASSHITDAAHGAFISIVDADVVTVFYVLMLYGVLLDCDLPVFHRVVNYFMMKRARGYRINIITVASKLYN